MRWLLLLLSFSLPGVAQAQQFVVRNMMPAQQFTVSNLCPKCELCGPGCICRNCNCDSGTQAARAPVGHTHTCPKCGTTWDHSVTPGHNCPGCGTPQYVQDQRPKPVLVAPRVVRQTVQTQTVQAVMQSYVAAPSACANGQCSTVSRRR